MFCTKEEFMRLSGWTRSYLNRQIRDGRVRVTRSGKIDLEAALPLLDKAKKTGTSAHSEWIREKAKGERYITKLRELRYKREHGAIEREVANAVSAIAGVARNHFEALPTKLALELCPENPARAERRLRVEIRQILHDMSGDPEPYDPDQGTVPSPALTGSDPATYVYDQDGKLMEIYWSQQADGYRWITVKDAGWKWVKQFFDSEGREVAAPTVADGKVIGGTPHRQFTNADGWRCRKTAGVNEPAEVYDEETGKWIRFLEYRRKYEKAVQ